jgi:hypothetical protein
MNALDTWIAVYTNSNPDDPVALFRDREEAQEYGRQRYAVLFHTKWVWITPHGIIPITLQEP